MQARLGSAIALAGLWAQTELPGRLAVTDDGPHPEGRIAAVELEPPEAGASELRVSALGDVDGDGRADFAVAVGADPAAASRIEVISGASGRALRIWRREDAGPALAPLVASTGDVDGDGRGELLLTAQGLEPLVASLESGGFLFEPRALEGGSRWVLAVASLGDADGDGRADHAFVRSGAGRTPSIQVVSGADAARLWSWSPVAREGEAGSQTRLALSIAPAGDADRDGRADLLVGVWPVQPFPAAGSAIAGRVLVLSGRDASVLREAAGPADGSPFGRSVARIGDADGDGREDYAVGTSGAVVLLSGADLGELRRVEELGDSGFGARVESAGDVDGDGRGDVLALSSAPPGRPARLRLISGGTGRTLFELPLPGSGTGLAAAPGDVDGDGRGDLVVGYPATPSASAWAVVLSGARLVPVEPTEPGGDRR